MRRRAFLGWLSTLASQEIVKKSRISHDPALGQWLPEVLQYYYASPHRS